MEMRRIAVAEKNDVIALYEKMVVIRTFEQKVSTLFAKNKLPGFVHLYVGQEAVAVGACSVLRKDDYITSTHRGHGHTIAKGGDVARMMAELYGKAAGYCKGKGGSMHITDMTIGMLGANGIVSGGLPIAVGTAYGIAKVRKTDQVVVPFFGDGALGEGPVYEAINIAAAWKLPIVFACENNLYGVSTRLGRVSATEDLSSRFAAFGIQTAIVDGNDVLAVADTFRTAVERARSGKGPTFVECKTWRQHGHFEGESPTYFNKEEYGAWKMRDPIESFARRLTSDGVCSNTELESINAAVARKIEEAVTFAESSPMPRPEEALEDVFGSMGK